MSTTNENVVDVLSRATDEQRGVEVDGRAVEPVSIAVPLQEYTELRYVRTSAHRLLKAIDDFVERHTNNLLSNGINLQTRLLREALDSADRAIALTASPVPPCLQQQFPTVSAIDRQIGETARRCDAVASDENAGERMSDTEPLD